MQPEEQAGKNSRETLRLFWASAARYPARLTIALVVPVLTVLLSNFAGPLVIAALLDQIQSGTLTWDSAWPLVILYALTQIGGEIIGWRVALWSAWTFEMHAMQELFERVFATLARQSTAFHADRFSGSLVSQTNKLTGAFENFWDTVVWVVVPITTTVVAAVVVLSFVLWPYALVLAVLSATFTWLVVATTRTMEPLNVAEAQAANRMTGFLADVTTNIGAVKAYGAEEREQAGAAVVAREWKESSFAVMRPFLRYSAGYAGISTTINVAAVLAAVLAATQDAVSIPAIYLAVTYTMTVTTQLWEINQVMRNYNRVMGDAHDMVEILALPTGVEDHTDTPLRPHGGSIDFDAITFGHDRDYDAPLFRDFTLQVPGGQRVGLVGHSGSGKSTLVRLLLRFADVDEGTIRIDGQDIACVTQTSLRRAISYVPQEPLLFHRSLFDNIAYGKTDASLDEIRAAAEQAYALDFIEALPQGFDTQVGERGVKLSGGQRQRIAIARTILKDAPILVLDEATSALDSESELHIQEALQHAMRGRTTIVIAHRLSTVQLMDRIIVLDAGRIAADGSHGELLAQGGAYATLWAHQSGGFLA
ncbi:MAG: ABC transporter ATP-binding protein [Candidatus Nanopelagicales bacterium]